MSWYETANLDSHLLSYDREVSPRVGSANPARWHLLSIVARAQMTKKDPDGDPCAKSEVSGDLMAAINRITEATERQTRIQAWTERARRFEWIGEISDDHVRGAHAVLWEQFGQQGDAAEEEIIRVIMIQRIYEYLMFCYEQEQLLERSGLDIDYEEWIRQMIFGDDDLVQVHLASGVAYPRFAHWFNRVVWCYGKELLQDKSAARTKRGRQLQKSAHKQALQIFARGYLRNTLLARAHRMLQPILDGCATAGECEDLLKKQPQLLDSLLEQGSVFKRRRSL